MNFKCSDDPMKQPYGKKKVTIIVLLFSMVVGLALVVFSNTLKSDFIYNWDDNINVTNNEHIRDWSKEGILRLFDPQIPVYEPRLTLFTFAWEYHENALNPAPYHLHNLLLHLLILILLFFFVKKILRKDWPALVVVFIFAVHPLHVEPVSWITGRKDLLFSLFYLGSMLAYIRYIGRPKNLFWFFLAVIFAFLGLLSKIQAMSIPLAWIALDVYFNRPLRLKSVFEKFLMVILLLYNYFSLMQLAFLFAVYFIIIYYDSIDELGLAKKIRGYIGKISHTVFKFLLGIVALCVLVLLLHKINTLGNVYVNRQAWFLSCFEVLFLVAASFISSYRRKGLILGQSLKSFRVKVVLIITLSLIVICIFSLFIPKLYFWTGEFRLDFSFIDRIFMACYALMYYFLHFIFPVSNSPIQPYPSDMGPLPLAYYLAAFGVVTILILVIFLIVKKKIKNPAPVIFGLIFFLINISMVLHLVPIEGRVIVADRYAYLALAGLLISSASLIDGWLFEKKRAVKGVVLAGTIILGLSFSLASYSRTKVWADGFALFNRVTKSYPDYPLAHINRGTLFLNKQQYQKAIADFDQAIRLDSSEAIAYYNRALAYYNLNDLNQAQMDCSRAVQFDPFLFDAWYLRAFIKNKSGNYTGAIADYNCSLRIRPDHKLAYYNRGNSRKNLLDYNGALSDYQKCIELDPGFDMAYSGEGVALYFLKDYKASVRSFDIAINKKPREGNYYFNRGLSKLKLNLTEEACRDFNTSWGYGYSASKDLIKEHCN